jgi:hypothetical protein
MDTSPSGRAPATTLLGLGAAAGPLYVIAGIAQILKREGFDWTRHALSLMSNGPLGWIQIANFMVCGLLVIGGAVGLKRAMTSGRGRIAAPVLIAIYGISLIGAGVFVADPAFGFPPGTPNGPPASITTHGLLHFVCGGGGFLALIAACFVIAARYAKERRQPWRAFSIATGMLFFAGFAGIASGSGSRALTVAFYFAVLLAWTWLTLIFLEKRPTI